jgi:hypothetical protein
MGSKMDWRGLSVARVYGAPGGPGRRAWDVVFDPSADPGEAQILRVAEQWGAWGVRVQRVPGDPPTYRIEELTE